jgi:hypothetical protein
LTIDIVRVEKMKRIAADSEIKMMLRVEMLELMNRVEKMI